MYFFYNKNREEKLVKFSSPYQLRKKDYDKHSKGVESTFL